MRITRFLPLLLLGGAALTACHDSTAPDKPTTAVAVSGTNSQSANRTAPVQNAPAVTLTDKRGNPAVGVVVSFAASADSKVTPSSVTTDATGTAKVTSWTLGSVAGTDSLTATATGYPQVIFTATALPAKVTSLAIVAGNNQTGPGFVAFATAPKVKVLDELGGPMPGVSVAFASSFASDSVIGATQTSAADGTASPTRWVPSAIGGLRTLTATVTGLPPVSFSAIGTAIAQSRSAGILCVDTIQVIGTQKISQRLGVCGLATLTTTANITSGVGTTALSVFVRGMQGSLAWNDATTSAAVTQINLDLTSGAYSTVSALVDSVQGLVNTSGSAKLSDVWTSKLSGTGTLTFTTIGSNGQASGGAIGCNNDPNTGAVVQMKAPVALIGSCDPNLTGGIVIASTIGGTFSPADFVVRLGFTSNGGFSSCAETVPAGSSTPLCIKGPKK